MCLDVLGSLAVLASVLLTALNHLLRSVETEWHQRSLDHTGEGGEHTTLLVMTARGLAGTTLLHMSATTGTSGH
jgi:hypothetical protein